MSAQPGIAPGLERVLRASMSLLLFRSWFDRASLATLRDWIFPASRLWASAESVGYTLEPFLESNPDVARAPISPSSRQSNAQSAPTTSLTLDMSHLIGICSSGRVGTAAPLC